MTNPVLEYLAEYGDCPEAQEVVKEASAASWWSQRSPLTRKVMLGAGAFIAGQAASEVYGGVKNAIQKAHGFRSMMKHNPALGKEDKKRVHALYNTLHNVSPDLARDPVVANSWVKRMMYQDEYVDPKTMSDLAGAQKSISQGRQGRISPFASAMSQSVAAKDDPYLLGGSPPAPSTPSSFGGGGKDQQPINVNVKNVMPRSWKKAQQQANQQWQQDRGPKRR